MQRNGSGRETVVEEEFTKIRKRGKDKRVVDSGVRVARRVRVVIGNVAEVELDDV